MACGDIAQEREGRLFAMLEAVPMAMEEPVDGDLIQVTGSVSMDQTKEQVKNEENRASRSEQPPIAGRLQPGTFSFPAYLKPNAAGALPELHPILRALFGAHTVNASVSVVYSFAECLDTVSLWYDVGHTVFFCRGGVVERGEFKMNGDSIASGTFSGKFAEMYHTGTDAVNDATDIDAVQTTITVDDGKKFSIGSLILIDAEEIKVGTVVGNVLTGCTRGYNSTTAAIHLDNAIITPYIPAGTADGAPVHAKDGTLTVGGVTTILTETTVTVENSVNFLENERNGLFTAEEFTLPENRTVKIQTTRFFRSSQLSRWQDAKDLTANVIALTAGNIVGKTIQFDLPTAIEASPTLSGDSEKTQAAEIMAHALDNNLEGEATLTFK